MVTTCQRRIVRCKQRAGRAYPQHEYGDVQSCGCEINSELPQSQDHEHHDKRDEHIDAYQQTPENNRNQHHGRSYSLRHITTGFLIDLVERHLGLIMELIIMFHIRCVGGIRLRPP